MNNRSVIRLTDLINQVCDDTATRYTTSKKARKKGKSENPTKTVYGRRVVFSFHTFR